MHIKYSRFILKCIYILFILLNREMFNKNDYNITKKLSKELFFDNIIIFFIKHLSIQKDK